MGWLNSFGACWPIRPAAVHEDESGPLPRPAATLAKTQQCTTAASQHTTLSQLAFGNESTSCAQLTSTALNMTAPPASLWADGAKTSGTAPAELVHAHNPGWPAHAAAAETHEGAGCSPKSIYSPAAASLLACSPTCATAFSMDGCRQGSVVFQSVTSKRYLGELSQLPRCNGQCAGVCSTYMPALRELFSLEGEEELVGMLEAMELQDPRATEPAMWQRVMRVPDSCVQPGLRPAVVRGPPTPLSIAPQDSASVSQDTGSCTPVSLEMSPRVRHTGSVDFPTDNLISPSGPAAEAVSIAVRVAPNRFKSLLDLSLSVKSRGSREGTGDRDSGVVGAGASSLTEHMPSIRPRSFVAMGIEQPHRRSAESALPSYANMRSKSMRINSAALSPLSGNTGSPPTNRVGTAGSAALGSVPVAPQARRFASAVLPHNGPPARVTADGLMRLGTARRSQDTLLDMANASGIPNMLILADCTRSGAGQGDGVGVGADLDGWLLSDNPLAFESGVSNIAALPSQLQHIAGPSRLGTSLAQQRLSHHSNACDDQGTSRAAGSRQQSVSCKASGFKFPQGEVEEAVRGLVREQQEDQEEAEVEEEEEQEQGGAQGQEDARSWRWHEVTFTQTVDETDRRLLMCYQNDVTVRTNLEMAMAELGQAQLNLMCQCFPRHFIEHLCISDGLGAKAPQQTFSHLGRSHSDVSILFMDIVGFTSMSKAVLPDEVMTFLNDFFLLLDSLSEVHGVQKVETAGDCYIVAAGIVEIDADGFSKVNDHHDAHQSAAKVYGFARDMLAASRTVLMPHDHSPAKIRIGIHSGDCVSGIVGSKLPKFSIFGDSMNTASRMESTCVPGRLQISDATYKLLMASGASSPNEWEPTGGIEVKGKGMMETFLWQEAPDFPQVGLLGSRPSIVLASGSHDIEHRPVAQDQASDAHASSEHVATTAFSLSVNCLAAARTSVDDGMQRSTRGQQLAAVESPYRAVSKALTAVARAQTQQQGGSSGRASGGRDSGSQALRKLLLLPDSATASAHLRHMRSTSQLNASSPQLRF